MAFSFGTVTSVHYLQTNRSSRITELYNPKAFFTHAALNIEFKELSLTRGQYLYLVRVCENPGIIQEKIAELIKVDRTTAARAIKRLEEQGFIYRQEDASNKKIKRIYATEKGKNVYPIIVRENQHSNQVALQGLSEVEISQLADYLVRMRKNVSEDWEFVKKGNTRNY